MTRTETEEITPNSCELWSEEIYESHVNGKKLVSQLKGDIEFLETVGCTVPTINCITLKPREF